jgi:hypothetical protein
MVMGFVVDFGELIICRGREVFLQGVFEKKSVLRVVFCGEFVVDAW